MTFQTKNFDGPLELLLQLISKAKIEIRDIFVSDITEQYIEYIHSSDFLDMEDATDFLVMAATLLEIKSRAMLPKPAPLPEDEEDPEAVLIRRLEEYKAFRETAGAMKQFETAAAHLFAKLPDEFPLPPQETELVGLNMEGLLEALKRVLERKPEIADPNEVNHYAPRDIHRDEHNVQDCMLIIMKTLRKKKSMRFEEAFSDAPSKEEVVTFFMALLELLRLGEMHADQERPDGEIILRRGRRRETSENRENNDQRGDERTNGNRDTSSHGPGRSDGSEES